MISNRNKAKRRTTVDLLLSMGLLIICMLGFAACDPEVESHTQDVEITIDVKQISAGYINVAFSTNKNAYYLRGIHPIREGIDVQKVAKHFMLLALDSAYVDYLYWRNQQLQRLTPFVADFASHSLQYGNTEHYFTLLQPSTDYWVFAFVVDPTTNKPAGKLFLQTISTTAESQMPMFFEYRVEGRWDYVYPKDTAGNINSHTPWVGETVDSILLRQQGWESPGEYFLARFKDVYNGTYERILYGIYAHENNGIGDGTSVTNFEQGKTYYSGMAALDALLTYPLDTNAYDIYRFRWEGETTDLYFTPTDCTKGEW